MRKETIAAIATPLNSSGIGIVRMSGPEAIVVADRVFHRAGGGSLTESETHTIHYGYAEDESGRIDEVLVMLMRGPRSFTAEDTVEFNCHGGVYILKRVFRALLDHGAVPAEPGEFTKRAFLNGRVDLTQAEAVMDMIEAQNELSLKASLSQLTGRVSGKIREIREKILFETAYIESALDDPEHISLDGYVDKLLPEVESLWKTCLHLANSFDNGRLIKEGVRTVILGRPNAGKSSVLNCLLEEERAIVTSIAGTTRDTLEESVNLGGILLHMVDTAGIHETDDPVESIGIRRALNKAAEAQLILYVADSTEGLLHEDLDLLSSFEDKPVVLLWNKTDLSDSSKTIPEGFMEGKVHVIPFCAANGDGKAELIDFIKQMFYDGNIDPDHEVTITNERHYAALKEAANSLSMVAESIRDGMPEDFLTIDLMNAYQSLGTIIGEAVEDDLADEIFSRFCMGK